MKKTKRLLSIVLCIVLLLTNISFADTPSDIKGHWAESQINSWLLKGYVKGLGDGSFKPNNEISRIEFVIMINRSFGFNEIEPVSFKDVKTGDWFYNEVAKAVKAGYISGQNDGNFKPNNKITRQEAAVILSRLFKLNTIQNLDGLAAFKDAASIPSWSSGAIGAVVEKGYMQGTPDKSFKPASTMTRAEAVVTLDRCYLDYVKAVYDKAGVYTAGTVEGSVEIKAADVTLENTVINGSLIVNESVGNGDVRLKNVVVQGSTIVRGGGLNSIIAENSTFKHLIINKEDNKVRFVASGSTAIGSVDMQSGGKLEEQGLTGTGFGTVSISEKVSSTESLLLIGQFASVNVKGANLTVDINGTVETLKVELTAKNTIVNLLQEAKVSSLIVDALTTVAGAGRIETAQVNVSGTKIGVLATTVNLGTGVTDVATYNPPAPSTEVSYGGGTPTPTEPTTPSQPTTPTEPATPSTPSAPNAYINFGQEWVAGVNNTMEYSFDNWATSTAITGTTISISSIIPIAGSLAITLKIRVKAAPAAEQTLTIPARPATPSYAIDFINERINTVASTDEYSYDNFATFGMNGNGGNISASPNSHGFPEKHIYFRKKATGTSFRSAIQHVIIPTRPSDRITVGNGTGDTIKVELASGTSGTRVTAQATTEVRLLRADATVKLVWEDGTPTGKDFPTAVYGDMVSTRKKATSTSFAGSELWVILNSANCRTASLPAPVISGVTIPAGTYKIGDQIPVTISTDGTGYTAGAIYINGINVANTLASAGGNSYSVTYTVASGNMDRASVGAIPISIVLYKGETPCAPYTTAATSSGSVVIDANAPNYFTVMQPTTDSNGINDDGKNNVTITWTDSSSTDVHHYEIVAKAGTAPTVADVVEGKTNIASGTQTATFEWASGANVYVAVVAVDAAGNKRLVKHSTSNVLVLADGVVTAGAATNIVGNDLDVYDDKRDFQVSFNAAADEALVSEYRVMVLTTGSAFSFDLAKANAVAAGNYIPVAPSNQEVYTVNFADVIGAVDNVSGIGTRDASGFEIHTGMPYKIFILSVAGGDATVNTLSASSGEVILSPYIELDLVAGPGNEAKFKIVGYGDYADNIYAAGSTTLLDAYGNRKTYFTSIYGSIFYKIHDSSSTPEAGDQITVTGDSNGTITISLIGGENGSLNGYYLLAVGPNGFKNYIPFVVEGTQILVVVHKLEKIDLGNEVFDNDTFAINYYHSGESLSYSVDFKAGYIDLLDENGAVQDYRAIPSSVYSYKLLSSVNTIEAGDQITATDDGTGKVTIAVTDGGTNPASLDGDYLLLVRDDNFRVVRGIEFTISGTTVTIK